jgi:hypothetical protein
MGNLSKVYLYMAALTVLSSLCLWGVHLQKTIFTIMLAEQASWDTVEKLADIKRWTPADALDAKSIKAQYHLAHQKAEWEAQRLAPQFDRAAKHLEHINRGIPDAALVAMLVFISLNLKRRNPNKPESLSLASFKFKETMEGGPTCARRPRMRVIGVRTRSDL